MTAPLLSVRNLRTVFDAGNRALAAVDDISFDVSQREVLGIVGESGSGKSVTALSIMGLLPEPPGRIASGAILFEGRDLVAMPANARRKLRGAAIGMVFQEPMTSLNPVFTVGDQIAETIRIHLRLSRMAARSRALELLERVGISAARKRLDDYPHQLSGGMRQRVMIAIALSCNPRLLIADEPTTALDVTIQAQILDLLRDLQAQTGMAVLFITHNMGVVAEFADRVLVMYAGRIVEQAPVMQLFDTPRHPYSIGLLASTPDIAADTARLRTIPGALPNLAALPPGCRFAPRCERAAERCRAHDPALLAVGAGHDAACIRVGEPA